MAGRKQHHIPQVLIRGFGRNEGGKSTLVWVYSATRGKYRSATEGVGSQRDFYSAPPTPDRTETLDDRITRHEWEHLTPLIEAFRKLGPGSDVEPRAAAEAVAHLSIRASHVRESFSSAFGEMVHGLGSVFLDPAQVVRLLKVHENPPGRTVRKMIDEAWVENRAALARKGFNKDVFQRTMLRQLRATAEGALAEHTPLVATLLDMMRGRALEMTREGHRRALAMSLVPAPRVETLAALLWTVQAGPASGCILPDCVATATLDDGDCLPLVFADSDRIGSVALPLSHDRVLVGSRRGPVAPTTQERAQSAAASWDYFIAREDDPANDSALPHVGRRIQAYLREAVEESIADIGT